MARPELSGPRARKKLALTALAFQHFHEGGHSPTKTLQGVHVDFDG